jgi:hypothetical protein
MPERIAVIGLLGERCRGGRHHMANQREKLARLLRLHDG